MPEEILFESESKTDRAAVAEYLRTVADRLDGDGALTLSAGADSVTLEVPATPTFEIKAEREGPAGGPWERSVEFELEWPEDAEGEAAGGGDLTIE